MRNVLVVFFMVVFSLSAKAEYDGYHISFTLENVNGIKSKGYAYVAAAYLNTDSIHNTEYLIKALDQSRQEDWANRTSLTYYKSRILYNYFSIPDQQKQYEYYLTGETSSPSVSIKNITINEMIDWSYLSGIFILKTSDFTWTESTPFKSYIFSGYLCNWQFFIHEKNKNIERIITKLELLAKEKEDIEKEMEKQESQYRDTELNNELEKINQNIDDQVSKAIEQLKDYKVAVVTYCTC